MIDTLTRSRWIRTTTAAGLVPLLLVTSVPACALRSDTSSIPAEGWAPQAAQQRRPGGLGPRVVSDSQSAARTLSDWSRIEAVPVGTKTEVQLYDDEAPPDSRRVTGRFHAATADTLTLTLEDLTATSSSTRTLVKSAVHSVSVRRPIRKRSLGWSILVAGTAILTLSFTSSGDLQLWGAGLFGASYAAPASLIGFFLQRRQRIYEVPPEASRLITPVDVPADVGPARPEGALENIRAAS